MEDRTFHLFPQLPWELREEIWQFAVLRRPSRRRSARIRHVRMDENRNLLPLGCNSNTDDAGDESDYTWDRYFGFPGVRTACRHSRAVTIKNWPPICMVCFYCERCRGCRGCRGCKRVFSSRAGGSRQIIDLCNDVCYITSDSWESLLRPWKPIVLRTKDIRGRIRMQEVLNIAIKFDLAWNEELENATCDSVCRELSPQLAFVVRLLIQLAPRGYSEDINLMLIDDVSKWQSFNLEGHGGRQIFDGDQEYVEIVSLAGAGHHVAMEGSPMDEFMEHLRITYLSRIIQSLGPYGWECLLYSGFFRPLLRRENYVPGRPK